LALDPAASGVPTAPGRDDPPGVPGSPGHPEGGGQAGSGNRGGGNGGGNGSGARILLDERGIDRSLMRIAHEVIERTEEPERLYLVAIPNGGIPLARRLAANLRQIADLVVPVGVLDTTLYRDDLLSSGERPPLRRTEMPSAVDDHVVVLVDDVVKTGRTIRAAMDALMDFGRPRAVQVVGLVDRGHRELPIKLDYVGKNVPTRPHEQVSLRQAADGDRETLELVILSGRGAAGDTDTEGEPAAEGGDA
jgi:pyrimidine operon attenuation protein/uracil phosphoribosyltransferase